MEINHCESQLAASAYLIEKCVARHSQFGGIRRTEVNQEAVVRKDEPRVIAQGGAAFLETLRLFVAYGS